MKPSILLIFIFASVTVNSYAQTYVDLMRIDHNQGISQSYDNDENSAARFDETTFDGLVPIVLDSSNVLITGVNLEHTTISTSPNSFTELYGLVLKLGYSHTFSDKFKGTFVALPKLSSGMKNVDQEHFQLGGVALFKLKKSQYLSYRFGIYANSDLFGPMVVPILGFYYRKDRWEANFALPISAWTSYDIGKSTKLGAKFQGINKSYLLKNSSPTYMEKINNEVSLFLQQGFGKWHIILAGGRTIGRTGKTYDTNDKLGVALSAIKLNNNRTALNDRFSDGFFVKTSLIFRLPTE